MKNILMVHYDLHFYRIPIYNRLAKLLKEKKINLIIWPVKIINNKDKLNFDVIKKDLNLNEYKQLLEESNISCVINFLQPSNPSIKFYLQMIFYTFFIKKIPLIYYGHGLNLESKSKLSDSIYNIIHIFYKSIILYTPNEINKLWKIHHKKIEIAYNTLDLSGSKELITDSKINLRKKYNLREEFVILFSGRIETRKKLNILVDFIKKRENNEIKLLIVGPISDKKLENELNSNSNIIYLGPIYDKKRMSEIFFIADVFSIPGHIGLGLVEALYWALPTVTLNVRHAPEIFYLNDSKNGFIVENRIEFENKLIELSKNKELVKKMSDEAKKTYEQKGSIDNMINGFLTSINKVLENK